MAFFGKFTLAALSMAVLSNVAMAQSDWKDRFSLGGDMRFRLDRQLDGFGNGSNTYDNYRARIRARLNIGAKINDSLSANIRISTGDGSGSIRTNNATLGFGSNGKPDYFNLAYLDYKLTDSINLLIGQSPNLFWEAGKIGMVHNIDMSWEGVTGAWKGDMGNLKPYVYLTYANVVERINNPGNQAATATLGPDIAMLGAQAGVKMNMDPLDINFAVSSFNYNNIKGLPSASPLCSGSSGAFGTCYGNTIDPVATAMKYDYKLLHAALEVGYNLGFAPLAVYTNYVTNSDPSNENVGWLTGLKLGNLKDQGSWAVAYNYRDMRKDSAVAIFTDNSFLSGGTDILGSSFVVGYQAWTNAAINFTWDSGKRNISNGGGFAYEDYLLDLVTQF